MSPRSLHWALASVVVFLLGGCSDAASSHLSDYERIMQEMEVENAAHAANVTSAEDMDAIHREETRYASAVGEMIHEMEGVSESLDGCSGMTMGGPMMEMGYGSMMEMADGMHDEMEAHRHSMDDVNSVDDARDIEDTYQHDMADQMESMEAHGGEMMSSRMTCG